MLVWFGFPWSQGCSFVNFGSNLEGVVKEGEGGVPSHGVLLKTEESDDGLVLSKSSLSGNR